jgi:hypothetical protein
MYCANFAPIAVWGHCMSLTDSVPEAAGPGAVAAPPARDPDAAARTTLSQDADYVLSEIARGEIPCAGESPAIAAAAEDLLKALSEYRSLPSAANEAALERCLLKLMALLCPITVLTLRDTDCDRTGGASPGMGLWRWMLSKITNRFAHDAPMAYRFSAGFFWLAIAIVVGALTASYFAGHPALSLYGIDLGAIATLVAPFTYGAMGACVFLLRSLHKHIYGRTFDRRRKPEYFNRVLLGAISGGATVLLINSTKGGGANAAATAMDVSVNALGFLAGYNTDLLFAAIERITNAILPKVPTAPTPVVTPPAPVITTPPVPPPAPQSDAGRNTAGDGNG